MSTDDEGPPSPPPLGSLYEPYPAPDELERRRNAGRALPARRAGQRPADLDPALEHPIPDRRPLLDILVGLVLLGLLLTLLALIALIALGLWVGPG
jgi:hypothetical protein